MAGSTGRFRESLLQWVWEVQQFEHRDLKTTCGESLQIEHPGLINHGEGPDFQHSRLKIGSMLWHGDVEIHIAENDWFSHNHHLDDQFEGVVLHVYLKRGKSPAITADGHTPYALDLMNSIRNPLYRLLLQKQQCGKLPCTGNLTAISEEVFHRQLEKAHREYFEYKAERLLDEYPSGKPVSDAWLSALITVMYETLGVAGNRSPMKCLAGRLLEMNTRQTDPEKFIDAVVEIAGVQNRSIWNHTGMRPAGKPENRIRQAAAIHFEILQTPFRDFLKQGASTWDDFISRVGPGNLPGRQMQNILFATVYLPALYLLGDLLFSNKLKNEALTLWQNMDARLPAGILKPFRKSGLPYQKFQGKFGLVHQLKRYCRDRNCHRCELFKKSIQP
jgi:ribosomal protein L21E